MRKDMSKVIVERPRLGVRSVRGLGHPTRRALKDEATEALRNGGELENDVGGKIPINPVKFTNFTKSFNEYLAPLRRYILKQVGRPWDDVYSEICQHLNRNSTTHDHIFSHLFSYVERHTYMGDDGVIYVNEPMYGARGPVPVDEYYCDTYVHPVTGLLCKPDKTTYRQLRDARREKDRFEKRQKQRIINSKVMFERDDPFGPWFRVDFEPAADAWNRRKLLNESLYGIPYVFESLESFKRSCIRLYGYPVSAKSRKSASKKDIKEYGLNKP